MEKQLKLLFAAQQRVARAHKRVPLKELRVVVFLYSKRVDLLEFLLAQLSGAQAAEEALQRNELNQQVKEHNQHANAHTEQPLQRVESPLDCSDGRPGERQENYLQAENDCHDDQEVVRAVQVVEEVGLVVDHTTVPEVEEGHHDEHVEHIGHVHGVVAIKVVAVAEDLEPADDEL